MTPSIDTAKKIANLLDNSVRYY
ncbi:hypothetical protein [Aquimarina sediminis]